MLQVGLDQLQETHGIMVCYAVKEIPATRQSGAAFRASLLAIDYGPLPGYRHHTMLKDLQEYGGLCKQSRCVWKVEVS
jgi:hypothetical protein